MLSSHILTQDRASQLLMSQHRSPSWCSELFLLGLHFVHHSPCLVFLDVFPSVIGSIDLLGVLPLLIFFPITPFPNSIGRHSASWPLPWPCLDYKVELDVDWAAQLKGESLLDCPVVLARILFFFVMEQVCWPLCRFPRILASPLWPSGSNATESASWEDCCWFPLQPGLRSFWV